MGPPQYPHHTPASLANETYQMMNSYDFLNSSNHHQTSFTGGFQHSPFANQGPSFSSNHLHFNQNQGMLFKLFFFALN